jgi:excisionase family DNA binding protein
MQKTVVDEHLYTFAEALRYLRTSRSTLNRMLKSGAISGHKVGVRWKFYQDDLKAAIRRMS